MLGKWVRQRYIKSQDLVHRLLELGGMGGAEEHPYFVLGQLFAQQIPGNGAVGLAQVIQLMQAFEGIAGLSVVTHAGAQGFQRPAFAAAQLFYSWPVVGATDIHSIRQSRHCLMRLPLTGFEVARHCVVSVGGGDKALHRQPQRLGDQARGEVAKVAGRHADHRLGAVGFGQLGQRLEVVANLRQQTADIDGVGGVQTNRLFQRFVVEGIFHQRLTGVEVAVDGDGADVAAEGAEKLFLQGADLALGIEDHHFNPLQPVEGVGHGGTCVTGGGGQYGDLVICSERSQALGHKATAKVLECQGRAVEQLKGISAIFQFDQRRREGEGGVNQLAYLGGGHFVPQQVADDAGRTFGQRQVQQGIHIGQRCNHLGEEEPLIATQTLTHRLREAHLFTLVLDIVKIHSSLPVTRAPAMSSLQTRANPSSFCTKCASIQSFMRSAWARSFITTKTLGPEPEMPVARAPFWAA